MSGARRFLFAIPAFAGVAAILAMVPITGPREETLALTVAKRIHSQLVNRGVHVVKRTDWAPVPTSQFYACSPTDEFDLEQEVRRLVDIILSSGKRTIVFYQNQPTVQMDEAYYNGVFVYAHRFVDPNTGRDCTMIQVWVG